MTLHDAACVFSDRYTRVSRHPVTILLLVPVGGLALLLGALAGQFQATMIGVTLVLSFDASLMSRCVALKQGQDAGEVE